MRADYARAYRIRNAITRAPDEATMDRLADQADAIAAPWHDGAHHVQWELLEDAVVDFRRSPSTMARTLDAIDYDRQYGGLYDEFPDIDYRTLVQARDLTDNRPFTGMDWEQVETVVERDWLAHRNQHLELENTTLNLANMMLSDQLHRAYDHGYGATNPAISISPAVPVIEPPDIGGLDR